MVDFGKLSRGFTRLTTGTAAGSSSSSDFGSFFFLTGLTGLADLASTQRVTSPMTAVNSGWLTQVMNQRKTLGNGSRNAPSKMTVEASSMARAHAMSAPVTH